MVLQLRDVCGHTVPSQACVAQQGNGLGQSSAFTLYSCGRSILIFCPEKPHPFVVTQMLSVVTALTLRGTSLAVCMDTGEVQLLTLSSLTWDHIDGRPPLTVEEKTTVVEPRGLDERDHASGTSRVSSCCFVAKFLVLTVVDSQGKPSRIELWDFGSRHRCWSSLKQDAAPIAVAPKDFGFVSVHKGEIRNWTLEQRPATSGPAQVECMFSTFQNTVELQGVQFVGVSTVLPSEVLALTSSGFLVSFKSDGTVDKWMDCKVCPATTLLVNSSHVVVMGSLTRLFTRENWEFSTRIKHESKSHASLTTSYLTSLTSNCSVAASTLERNMLLWFADGSMVRYSFAADDPAKKQKLSTKVLFERPPLEVTRSHGQLTFGESTPNSCFLVTSLESSTKLVALPLEEHEESEGDGKGREPCFSFGSFSNLPVLRPQCIASFGDHIAFTSAENYLTLVSGSSGKVLVEEKLKDPIVSIAFSSATQLAVLHRDDSIHWYNISAKEINQMSGSPNVSGCTTVLEFDNMTVVSRHSNKPVRYFFAYASHYVLVSESSVETGSLPKQKASAPAIGRGQGQRHFIVQFEGPIVDAAHWGNGVMLLLDVKGQLWRVVDDHKTLLTVDLTRLGDALRLATSRSYQPVMNRVVACRDSGLIMLCCNDYFQLVNYSHPDVVLALYRTNGHTPLVDALLLPKQAVVLEEGGHLSLYSYEHTPVRRSSSLEGRSLSRSEEIEDKIPISEGGGVPAGKAKEHHFDPQTLTMRSSGVLFTITPNKWGNRGIQAQELPVKASLYGSMALDDSVLQSRNGKHFDPPRMAEFAAAYERPRLVSPLESSALEGPPQPVVAPVAAITATPPLQYDQVFSHTVKKSPPPPAAKSEQLLDDLFATPSNQAAVLPTNKTPGNETPSCLTASLTPLTTDIDSSGGALPAPFSLGDVQTAREEAVRKDAPPSPTESPVKNRREAASFPAVRLPSVTLSEDTVRMESDAEEEPQDRAAAQPLPSSTLSSADLSAVDLPNPAARVSAEHIRASLQVLSKALVENAAAEWGVENDLLSDVGLGLLDRRGTLPPTASASGTPGTRTDVFGRPQTANTTASSLEDEIVEMRKEIRFLNEQNKKIVEQNALILSSLANLSLHSSTSSGLLGSVKPAPLE